MNTSVKRKSILLATFIFSFTGFYYSLLAAMNDEKTSDNIEVKNSARNGELKGFALQSFADTEFQTQQSSMGLGFFKPNFKDSSVLYFWENGIHQDLDALLMDSVVFSSSVKGSYQIAQAPPWLVPAYMKLDYDLLYFKVISIGSQFLEIEVNKINGKTMKVARDAGELLLWPDLLLTVSSIELLDEEEQKIHVRPFEKASVTNQVYNFMKPTVVRNEWIGVALYDDNYSKVGTGWVRWRKSGKLLIKYSFLS